MSDPSDSSPLLEAAPESLDELFSRDPLKLTAQNLDTIIAKLREGRAKWQAKDAEERLPKPKAPGKKSVSAIMQEKIDKPQGTLSLEDLGL